MEDIQVKSLVENQTAAAKWRPLVRTAESPVDFSTPTTVATDQAIDYKKLIHKFIFKYWYLYMLFGPACLALAYFGKKIAEPTFGIQSKILIKEVENEFGATEDWLKRSLNFTSVSENVSNEIQVLSSFSLMGAVVNELGLDIKYNWNEGFKNREGYHDFPIILDTVSISNYEYLYLPFDIIPLDEKTFSFEQDSIIGRYQFGQLFTNKYGTFKISVRQQLPIHSDSTMQVIVMNPNAVTEGYLRNFKIEHSDENSTMLELFLEDAVPQKGIDVMTTLIAEYARVKNEENSRTLGGTLEFIDDRLKDVSNNLRSVESSVEAYKLRNRVTAETTSDLDIVLKKASKLALDKRDLELQLNMLELMGTSLETDSGEFELISANVSSISKELYDLVELYNDLVLERRQLLKSAGHSNPVIQNNTEKLKNLKNTVAVAIATKRSEVALKIESTTSEYESSAKRLRRVPTIERNLADKERERAIIENLYVYLLQKREEAALARISSSQNFKLIDAPRSSIQPISPKSGVYYVAGLFGGLGIPLMLIFAINFFRNSVHTEEEIKEIIPNRSIIGVISKNKKRNQQVVRTGDNSLASEHFRSLRANLDFIHKNGHQSILVTSSTSNEGKTFVACNLAISFAIADKKTVLVDFDLRKPDVLNTLNNEMDIAGKGLSDYLEGSTSMRRIIRQSVTAENLHLIPGGKVSKNPAELLKPHKLHALFSYLRKNYDVVVIDTAPIGRISDAILLSKHVTKSLFVIRAGFTKSFMIENAKDFFDQGKLVEPSVVLNGAKESKLYGYANYG